MPFKVFCDIKDAYLIASDLYENFPPGTCCARMLALVLHIHVDQSTSASSTFLPM